MTDKLTIDELIERLLDGQPIDAAQVARLALEEPRARHLIEIAQVIEVLRAQRGSGTQVAAPPGWEPGQVRGAYRLVRLLGHGGMGEVWLAQRCDGQLEQQVAIKRVNAAHGRLQRRLAVERQILARLQHQNIAHFLDAGHDVDGSPLMVMEYVAGERIDDWCDRKRATLHQRVDLLLAVADAVDYAHHNLVVHRDIKPGNVLVTSDGTPKLLDFGIARLLGDEGGELTQTGMLALTPAYVAPELLRGGSVTTAVDVYGLGLLAFRLLAGRLPALRHDTSLLAIGHRLAEEEAEPMSEALAAATGGMRGPIDPRALRGDLDAVVAMALRPEPKQRYASAGEFAADLRRWREGLPVLARGRAAGYRLRRFAWRYRGRVASAAIALVGLVAGTVVAVHLARVASESERTARAVQRFLEEVFTSADPWREPRAGRVITALDLAERGLARIETDLATQPRAQAELYMRLGRVFSVDGDAGNAVFAYDRAAEIFARLPDATARERIDAPSLAALARFYVDDLDTAQAQVEAVLEREAGALQAQPALRVVPLAVLYDITFARGDFARARGLLARRFELAPHAENPARETANLHYRAAQLNLRAGDLRAARRHALASLRFVLDGGEETPQWMSTLVERAMQVVLAVGPHPEDLARAEAQARLREAIFGADSVYAAQAWLTLARARLDAGELDAARLRVEQVLAAWSQSDGARRVTRVGAEARYVLGLVDIARGQETAALEAIGAARGFLRRIAQADAPPLLAADAAWAYASLRLGTGSTATLDAIAQVQLGRCDFEAPRTALWLASVAARREQASEVARLGLACLDRQGRPEHRLGAQLRALSGTPGPASDPLETTDLHALRAAIDAVDEKTRAALAARPAPG